MREIKFRAWVNKLGCWADEVICCQVGDVWGNLAIKDGIKYHNIEVMQYTGLKDKNGKEIYEGDCIRFTGACFVKGFSYVLWSDREAMFVDVSGCPICDRADIEVIGNIHQNPDLLGR